MFGTVGNNAPFIGLFGTVIRVILAFKELGRNPKGGLEVVGPAIAEALVATAVQPARRHPAVVMFNWCKNTVKGRIGNVDFLSRIVLARLGDGKKD
ncbi:MAG: MotA/TolQ/ExbB proton channel family protein [bacterium]